MNREILRLALPNILSNVSVPLISSFDTALMGGLSAVHIAAVGLGSMAINIIYWNLNFLRMSTTGLTAQAFGRGEEEAQLQTLWRAGAVALGLGILVLLIRPWLAGGSFWVLNLRADQLPLISEYFHIRLWAAPAAVLQLVLLGWLFGRQNARWPLYLTLIVNLTNLGLSYYFVRVAGYGIAGVAWGTVAAQYVGLIVGLAMVITVVRRLTAVRLSTVVRRITVVVRRIVSAPKRRNFVGRLSAKPTTTIPWANFFSLNRDIFLRTLCLSLSFIFFYNRANALDVAAATVSANVILLQLVNWLSYGTDGFAYAAESLVGKYAGAGEPKALRRVVRLIFYWGMGLAGVYALVYGVGGRGLLGLFTADAPLVLVTAVRYLPTLVVFCLLATPCYLLDGIFVGLTAARDMRQTMLIALAGYLVAYYSVGQHFGNGGLWGSLLLFMVLRGVLLARRLPSAYVPHHIHDPDRPDGG